MTYEYYHKNVGTESKVYFKLYMRNVLELQLRIIQFFLVLKSFTETKTRNKAILLYLCIQIPLLVNYGKNYWYFLTKDHICDFFELWNACTTWFSPRRKSKQMHQKTPSELVQNTSIAIICLTKIYFISSLCSPAKILFSPKLGLITIL